MYLYPGLKFYPMPVGNVVSFGIGPSFGFGFGEKYVNVRSYDLASKSYRYSFEQRHLVKAGILVNMGVNILIWKALSIGLGGAVGFLYKDDEGELNGSPSHDLFPSPMFQGHFTMGLRF